MVCFQGADRCLWERRIGHGQTKIPQLKLGKGEAFVKTRLKRLAQEDETWEADFRALPKPISQSTTHYFGLVVSQPDGFLLAE